MEKLISARKPKRVEFNGFLITFMYICGITCLEEHLLCVMGFDISYSPHSFLSNKWCTFLTSQNWYDVCQIRKYFISYKNETLSSKTVSFQRNTCSTHFWHAFGGRFPFLLSQKVTPGCAEVLLNACVGPREGAHVSLCNPARHSSLPTSQSKAFFFLLDWKHYTHTHTFQTWGKYQSKKKIKLEDMEMNLILSALFLLPNLIKLLLDCETVFG